MLQKSDQRAADARVPCALLRELRTRVPREEEVASLTPHMKHYPGVPGAVVFWGDRVFVPCGGGSVIELLQVGGWVAHQFESVLGLASAFACFAL